MKATLVQLGLFESKWKALRLPDDDLRELELSLMRQPLAGKVMRGTGGLRKVRFAPPSWHTGKSGAVRVCYVWFPEPARLYLVTLFAKSESENLSDADKAAIKAVLERIKRPPQGGK